MAGPALSSKFSPLAMLNYNKPGTPESRAADRARKTYTGGAGMLANNDMNSKQVL